MDGHRTDPDANPKRRTRRSGKKLLQDMTEAAIIPDRSSRGRKPPLRYSQTPVTKRPRRNNISSSTPAPTLDYKQAVTANTNGQIPEASKYEYDPIELDVSQLYQQNDEDIVPDDSGFYEELSPIILNTYSLANHVQPTEDEEEKNFSSYNSNHFVSPYPTLGKAKVILRCSTGLIIEGVQCPRF